MTSVTRIEKGLDLPIAGTPEQVVAESPQVTQVALIGDDYVGMKPTMEVAEGDRVKLGQILFTDKKTPGVVYTSPASGTVSAINRGLKRKFESVVIDVEGDEQETFKSYSGRNLAQLDRREVCELLIASGLWTALRTRPYSRVPAPDTVPHSLFVTAMDSRPLAADPEVVLANSPGDFIAGLQVLSTISEGKTHVCRKAGSEIPGEDLSVVEFHAFDGPHPSGLPGTHIHFIDPVYREKTVWHIDYQDVVAVGHLFLTGTLSTNRVISLAGPLVTKPRLVRTRLGASLSQLTRGEYEVTEGQSARVVSGSVLSGRAAMPPIDFLGRYHTQISILEEGHQREFLGWMMPGSHKFSIRRVFASAWARRAEDQSRRFRFTTNTEGSPRAIVPIGMYEEVMPLDIIATPLLKALITNDIEYAQELGALELDEEDLGLCTFVCPGKYEYGPLLRQNLTVIEHEG